MRKIANTLELRSELQRLLAYAQSRRPSRALVARKLASLGNRVAVTSAQNRGTVNRKASIRRMDQDDIERIPIANESEARWARHLFLMWAGEYTSKQVFVWADHLEDAFEELVEWLDDHAPGLLTRIDYDEAMEDLGFKGMKFDDLDDDQQEQVREQAEMDLTLIGHTTLTHGDAIESWTWGGDDVTDEGVIDAVKVRSGVDLDD